MPYQVHTEHKPNTLGLDDRIWVLEDGQGGRVEIWPARGFNAYRWRTPTGHELLYADPDFFAGSKPTRSGIPILFPFPNRIRHGRFTWEGKDYQLPLNDPSGKNAIHGFVHDKRWRVVKEGSNEKQAGVTAEFQASIDAPATLQWWPADYRLQMTYCLYAGLLFFQMVVENPGKSPLPFGLGFHPYFQLAPFGGEQAILQANVEDQWELQDSLPTGKLIPVGPEQPMRTRQAIGHVVLDDLFSVVLEGRVMGDKPPANQIFTCASLTGPTGAPRLRIGVGGGLPYLVLFTPPHRQAICLEPYTCVTNAVNLNGDFYGGWSSLLPGGTWSRLVGIEAN